MAELELKNITKSFGDVNVIKGVDLHIKNGEFVVFVGPSGCGKSTMLRMIAGLESISSGEMLIDGNIVNNDSPAQRGIAMVFQSYALYPHLTVRQNLSFGLENIKMDKKEIALRIVEVAKMLSIEDYLDRKPKALSGGQRQRVAIGRAIARNPKLFLFDEPLSNLDAKLRVQTRDEISRLHRELETTMIYVTHDQVEAMTMAQRIVVLHDGYVEQFGTPLELFNSPANLFVAEFIGSPSMNIYPGIVESLDDEYINIDLNKMGKVSLNRSDFSARLGASVQLGIRPSHIEFRADYDPDALQAKVTRIEKMGHETFIYLDHPDKNKSSIIHVADHLDIERGQLIYYRLPAHRCHLFDSQTTESLRLISKAKE